MKGQYGFSLFGVACKSLLVHEKSLYTRYSASMKYSDSGFVTREKSFSKDCFRGTESVIMMSDEFKLLLTIINVLMSNLLLYGLFCMDRSVQLSVKPIVPDFILTPATEEESPPPQMLRKGSD